MVVKQRDARCPHSGIYCETKQAKGIRAGVHTLFVNPSLSLWTTPFFSLLRLLAGLKLASGSGSNLRNGVCNVCVKTCCWEIAVAQSNQNQLQLCEQEATAKNKRVFRARMMTQNSELVVFI